MRRSKRPIAIDVNPKSGTGARATQWFRSLADFAGAERQVIVAFLVSRALIWSVAWFSVRWFKPGMLFKKAPRGYLWDLFFSWDSGWLLSIFENGYGFVPGKESSVAFFPLYPLAAGTMGTALGISAHVAGFLLSNLSLLAASIILRRLVSADYADRPRIATRSVWFLMLTPAAPFYTAFYSESLFLFLSLLSYYCARRGRWAGSAVAGALLSATRSNGFVLLPALLCEAWQQDREGAARGQRVPRWRAAWLAVVPLGLATYMAYLYFRFGDPLVFLKAQAVWGRTLAAPWTSLLQALRIYDQAYARLFVGSAIAAILLLFVAVRVRLRTSMLIYAVLMVLLALSSNLLESVPRYLSAVFPLYIGLAVITDRSESLFTAAIAGSVAVMTLCTALFVCGYWMT